MEFWGVDVKSGESLKVSPGDGMVLHLSQACIGEMKKEKVNETVCLFVNVDGKKLVLGTLFTDKLPQQQFDLVFDRDFEISHNWKSGTVYFYGYKANNPFDDDELPGDSDESESESEEDIPNSLAANVNSIQNSKKEKPVEVEKVSTAKAKVSKAGIQKVKIVEPPKDVNPKEADDSSEDGLMSEGEDDSEDEDDSDESDEETPKKVVEPSKKRPAAESASKTPISDKKAKATPQKTDGQKVVGHVATPYPVKQGGKTPANKPNQQTPKSGGSHSCKPCNRTFGSEKALESHSKAKHGN